VRNVALNAVILVDQSGMTVYRLTTEKGKSLRCTGPCVKAWPPLLLRRGAKPQAGKGVTKAKLATIRRPDGSLQVTYFGFALYRFVGDQKPGQANGQGLQKVWYAVAPSGRIVKTARASG
jgi:predicted lipoprotein with Yx(FWY)xxD motif